ncbi:MAG: gamma-glutamylcyclotransferase family protein [Agitococcus sp.]|nr:gamma-glutamylcyclotransferase family protein [Agitococcus sp.]
MKHYFAYGANIDIDKMFDRCPHAKFIEVGEIKGYRFIINTRGVASIVPDSTSSVSGIIWTITDEDEAFLDHFEEVKGEWYRPFHLKILIL